MAWPTSPEVLPTTMVDGTDMGDETPGSTNVGPHATWHRNAHTAINTMSAGMIDSGMGVAVHGSNASFARPLGWKSVTWIGSVQPSNGIDNDVWVDTA